MYTLDKDQVTGEERTFSAILSASATIPLNGDLPMVQNCPCASQGGCGQYRYSTFHSLTCSRLGLATVAGACES
jgi:hypothetical protein